MCGHAIEEHEGHVFRECTDPHCLCVDYEADTSFSDEDE